MPSLYVAGPSPTQRVSPDERRQINEIYRAIADWSSVHDVMFSIPSDQPAWLTMPPPEFSWQVRRLISESTHVLVTPLADSSAIGIEAEYAHQLKKPLAVWYPNPERRSRMLSAIATLERDGDESIDSLLKRFMR